MPESFAAADLQGNCIANFVERIRRTASRQTLQQRPGSGRSGAGSLRQSAFWFGTMGGAVLTKVLLRGTGSVADSNRLPQPPIVVGLLQASDQAEAVPMRDGAMLGIERANQSIGIPARL